MKVVVTLTVLIEADSPDGSIEVGPLRDAVYAGLDTAKREGYLTPLGDETTNVYGYSVSHVSTCGG